MCRFLLIKSASRVQPLPYLRAFAAMAEQSRSPDGDLQEDGWGVAWLSAAESWNVYRSARPVWEDANAWPDVPVSRLILVHARSATFREQKGRVDCVQPYTLGKHAFVFNGFLQGVSLPAQGEVGSQKIWSLLSLLLEKHPPDVALMRLKDILLKRSSSILALNIGLSNGKDLYILCDYSCHPEYYQLWTHKSASRALVSSEPLEGFSFTPLPVGRALYF